jgi:DNA-binding SARP family transcriptional activator/DNA-binding HxlR family transcriptional regulator
MMQLERWSLLIVREAMLRNTSRFTDFQHSLGITPHLLAARLDDLVSMNILTVSPDAGYVLTDKGWDLETTISSLSQWSERWPARSALAVAEPHEVLTGVPAAVTPTAAAGDTHNFVTADAFLAADGVPGVPDVPVEIVSPSTPSAVAIEITLLGTFDLRVGGKSVGPLSVGSQRLLVFLALHDRAVGRAAMAGRMWPEASDERAGISLRSALSRLDAPTREAILTASAGLKLADTVVVDLRTAQALAHRLLQPNSETRHSDLTSSALAALAAELLPDWYDDWVIAEAEDWRQLRLSALKKMASLFTVGGRLADAAGAARAAMKVEPLRESAHATLIRVHLAEGNQSEALRVYERYSALLDTALGIAPTPRLAELVSFRPTR